MKYKVSRGMRFTTDELVHEDEFRLCIQSVIFIVVKLLLFTLISDVYIKKNEVNRFREVHYINQFFYVIYYVCQR